MLQQKLPQQEQGFTLAEVLIAILIVTLFIAASMQAMVSAAFFRVRAQQFAEATTWIQQDIENVKLQAAQLRNTRLTAPAGAADTVLQVSWVTGFAVGDTLTVATPNNRVTNRVIAAINPGALTIRISTALGIALPNPNDVEVFATNLCNANATNTGLANSLQQNLPVRSNNGTKPIKGKTFTLNRAPTVRDAAPFNVLQLNYRVAQGNDEIATLNTEVIPDVALRCP